MNSSPSLPKRGPKQTVPERIGPEVPPYCPVWGHRWCRLKPHGTRKVPGKAAKTSAPPRRRSAKTASSATKAKKAKAVVTRCPTRRGGIPQENMSVFCCTTAAASTCHSCDKAGGDVPLSKPMSTTTCSTMGARPTVKTSSHMGALRTFRPVPSQPQPHVNIPTTVVPNYVQHLNTTSSQRKAGALGGGTSVQLDAIPSSARTHTDRTSISHRAKTEALQTPTSRTTSGRCDTPQTRHPQSVSPPPSLPMETPAPLSLPTLPPLQLQSKELSILQTESNDFEWHQLSSVSLDDFCGPIMPSLETSPYSDAFLVELGRNAPHSQFWTPSPDTFPAPVDPSFSPMRMMRWI